ncbi:MAG: diacylglycerol/lipid kinase family protein [Longimicrobiales bacterium]
MPVLVNVRAGRRTERALQPLRDILNRAGVLTDIQAIEPERLARALGRLVAAHTPVVAVAGGDGSLRTAANVLAGTTTALGVIPLGTLNHFARRIGVPDPPTAARTLRAGRLARVSLGIVGAHVFLNTATFGEYGRVVHRRERLRRLIGKWPGALLGLGEVVLRSRRLQAVIETPTTALQRATPLLWVGIGRESFPRALDDPRLGADELEVVVLRPCGRLEMMRVMAVTFRDAWRGRRSEPTGAIELLHTRSLLVRSDAARIDATLDGELHAFEPPVFVAVQENALRVLVPPDA